MSRLRVTDRISGEVVAELDPADRAGVAGRADPADRPAASGPGGLEPRPPASDPLILSGTAPGTRGRTLVEVVVDGWRFEFEVEDAARADLRRRATAAADTTVHDGPTEVRAIIPGRVASVAVTVGEAVVAGQRLLAVEAMKMVNELRAPRDGTIERIAATTGQTIELGDLLVVLR